MHKTVHLPARFDQVGCTTVANFNNTLYAASSPVFSTVTRIAGSPRLVVIIWVPVTIILAMVNVGVEVDEGAGCELVGADDLQPRKAIRSTQHRQFNGRPPLLCETNNRVCYHKYTTKIENVEQPIIPTEMHQGLLPPIPSSLPVPVAP